MSYLLIGLAIFGFVTLTPAFIFRSIAKANKSQKRMVAGTTLTGWLVGAILYLVLWIGAQTFIQTETYEEASNVEIHIIGGEYYVNFEFKGEQHLKELSKFNVTRGEGPRVAVKKLSGGSRYFIEVVERIDYILYMNLD